MSSRSQEAAAVVVTGYHAHVYFDAATRDQAWALRNLIEENFDIEMGRFHEKPVGPHPRFSYQVAFTPAQFGQIVPWLARHRGGLTVFVHGLRGGLARPHRFGDLAWPVGPIKPGDVPSAGGLATARL